MILVDSCVWIDWLKDNATPQVEFLKSQMSQPLHEICISGIVYFEVLRGIRKSKERESVARYFEDLERREFPPHGHRRWVEAYWVCQERGVALDKIGDWLIAMTAIEHRLDLLTSDRDFNRLAGVLPLQLVSC